jgi:hypothetical protein
MSSNFESEPERLFRREDAARYLLETWNVQRSVATLARLAVTGNGPEFRKSGRTPLYPQDSLDSYARSLLTRRVRSTAELRALDHAGRELPEAMSGAHFRTGAAMDASAPLTAEERARRSGALAHVTADNASPTIEQPERRPRKFTV